jgi:hypothetical protein
LSYSAPPAIALLLPAPLMEKYQTIHNLLLRISRVQLVLRTIYIDTTHRSEAEDDPKTGVDVRARPRPRPRDQEEASLFAPITKMGMTVHRLRFRMSTFMDAIGRYITDRAIGTHWDAMRRRLSKLRRKETGKASSRPATPSAHEEEPEMYFDDLGAESDDEAEATGSTPLQLHSIHSLVAYHHLTLDKILRATLQAPSAGQQVTFKVMMSLFGLILDLGKLVKEIQRGVVGEDAEDRVEGIKKDWEEREGVFVSLPFVPRGGY